ncbi:FAD:protein FMN transferase [bacterium]|nr:FAD:protein FMN transferase [bacterium]MBU3956342.1 FAD:protein FMN transferase [bacterium]
MDSLKIMRVCRKNTGRLRFLLLAAIVLFSGCSRGLKTRRFLYFGTFIDISLPVRADEKIFGLLEDEIKRCDNLLNVKNGVTAELNKKSFIKNAELAALIKRVKYAHSETGGLFDPTVEPVLKVTGFSPVSEKFGRAAPPEIMKKALSEVGFDKIKTKNDIITLNGALLNFGGCGKGYLLEKLAKTLLDNGINNALINAGGDILAIGKHLKKPWRIGVRSPGKKSFTYIIAVTDEAVATSGDYENFFIDSGKKYSHIVNPSTGQSSEKRQVTVICKEPLVADIYATVFMLMATDKALHKADALGMGVMIYAPGEEIASNKIFRDYLIR